MGKKISIIFCFLFFITICYSTGYEEFNFTNYKVIPYYLKQNEIYDSMEIVYQEKSINDDYVVIVNYFIVGYVGDNKYILAYVTLNEAEDNLYGMVYNRFGEVVYNTSISGNLAGSDVIRGNFEVFGLSPLVLKNPLVPRIFYLNRKNNQYQTSTYGRMTLDSKNYTVVQFTP